MPDAYARIRKGERRPLYGQALAPVGQTLSIQPGATYTLYAASGSEVAGHTALPVSGYESGPLESPRVWVILDTQAPVDLPAGYYTLVFRFQAAGSDGITRVFVPGIEVEVEDTRR
jgi:hypothetical protein